MASRQPTSARPPTRRQPLTDATSRVNVVSTPPPTNKGRTQLLSSPIELPHHESMRPNGMLNVPDGLSPPENKRIAAVSKEAASENKRDSTISNTSTNGSGTARRKKRMIGPWELGITIGKGGCSRVRAVRHCENHHCAAAKIISKSTAEKVRAMSLANLIKSMDENQKKFLADSKAMPFGLEREIVIMKLLDHPNIVHLYDVWENRNELYLIMEYVKGGELFDYVDKNRRLEEPESVFLFRQIVSALLYCHRFHIYHRDLKPENILLDRESHCIKLVDFGMAALQPHGRFLITPCGSPHYAAPEVVKDKPYDGAKADIWSCGVILYVMLTGMTPFNFRNGEEDIRLLFKAIMAADYYMPKELSEEAQDLLRRILVPDPKKRISLQAIWDHPFMHKYDRDFGYSPEDLKVERWIGPQPTLEDWTITERHQIDTEVLRNLRTLWHSEKEEALIQKLINREMNQEKYFYHALIKHREDHLENWYWSNPSMVEHSASDYHHIRHGPPLERPPPLPLEQQRSASQYSILNNEHLRSESIHGHPPSVASYDPFRASRDPIVERGDLNQFNVTVHRHASAASKGLRPGSIKAPQVRSLRHETLKRNSRRSSMHSMSSLSRRGSPAMRLSSAQRSTISRSSLASSSWASSPPVLVVRPSSSHKRNVDFSHIRRSSTASALTSNNDTTTSSIVYSPERKRRARLSLYSSDNDLQRSSSPTVQNYHVLRSRKENIRSNGGYSKLRNSMTPIDNEVRKVSTEFGQFCEEVLYRSSVTSSLGTSFTDKACETPPSSVSRSATDAFKNRPLPTPPVETPNTFVNRTILETRNKIVERLDASDNTDHINEILAQLDRLVKPTAKTDGKRNSSAPEPTRHDNISHLPAIDEEGKSEEYLPLPSGRPERRSATDPTETIRMIDASSPIRPLNIRKQSVSPTAANPATNGQTLVQSSKRGLSQRRKSLGGNSMFNVDKQAESEAADFVRDLPKKKSWFRRKEKSTTPESEAPGQQNAVAARWRDLDDRLNSTSMRPTPPPKSSPVPQSLPRQVSLDSEFPVRKRDARHATEVPHKKGFLKLFGKGKKEREEAATAHFETSSQLSESPSAAASSDFLRNGHFGNPSNLSLPLSSNGNLAKLEEPHQNWLARFLHIKPATRLLCFNVSRGRARTEIVRLLRAWKKHGIRDVWFDRERNAIGGRVDRENALKVRPVTFSISLFVVLENGQRRGLSIARWVQVKGAKSAFGKVVEAVETVMGGQGLLVTDEVKRKGMCAIVEGSV